MTEGLQWPPVNAIAVDDLEDEYEVLSTLGSGATSTVYKCRRIENHRLCALKAISRDYLEQSAVRQERLRREVTILRECMRHENINIVKLYRVLSCSNFVYLELELCGGGELFDAFVGDLELGDLWDEDTIRYYMRQALCGLGLLHTLNIVHRDLKPENMLLSDESHPDDPLGRVVLKLCDFGFAKKLKGDAKMSLKMSVAGTPLYSAPEVFGERPYNISVDLWSFGVCLYTLLSGTSPFVSDDTKQMFEQIEAGDVHFESTIWDSMPVARDLVSKLLSEARYTMNAVDALEHAWFRREGANEREADSGEEDSDNDDNGEEDNNNEDSAAPSGSRGDSDTAASAVRILKPPEIARVDSALFKRSLMRLNNAVDTLRVGMAPVSESRSSSSLSSPSGSSIASSSSSSAVDQTILINDVFVVSDDEEGEEPKQSDALLDAWPTLDADDDDVEEEQEEKAQVNEAQQSVGVEEQQHLLMWWLGAVLLIGLVCSSLVIRLRVSK
jgi:serine/threonine protein kinase